MTKLPTQPRPCTDPDCRGPHSPRERVALAVSICEGRGVRMTALRKRVLELLWASGRPTGAYELIEAIKLGNSRPVGPPTVYRALEFLMVQGLVSRIESLNAYVPCIHPRARSRLPVLHLQRLPGIGRDRGSADRRAACRGCRRPRVCRDTSHGRGRGHVRAVRRCRASVGGNEEIHRWRAGIRLERRSDRGVGAAARQGTLACGHASLRSGCCRLAPGPGWPARP